MDLCNRWRCPAALVLFFGMLYLRLFSIAAAAETASAATERHPADETQKATETDASVGTSLKSGELRSSNGSTERRESDKQRKLNSERSFGSERLHGPEESEQQSHSTDTAERQAASSSAAADDYYDEYEASFIRRHYGEVLAAASSWDDDSLDEILDLRNGENNGMVVASSRTATTTTTTELLEDDDDDASRSSPFAPAKEPIVTSSLNEILISPSFSTPLRSLELTSSSPSHPSAHEYFVDGEKLSTLDPVDAAHVFEWGDRDPLDTSTAVIVDVDALQSHRSVRSVSASFLSSAMMMSSMVIASSVVSQHSDVLLLPYDEIVDDPFFDFSSSLSEDSAVAYATLTKISKSSSAMTSASLRSEISVESNSHASKSPVRTSTPLSPTSVVSTSGSLSRTAFSNRDAPDKKQILRY